MGVLARIGRRISPPLEPLERADTYSIDWYLGKLHGQFTYDGTPVLPTMTWEHAKQEPIGDNFAALLGGAYNRNGIVFATVVARALVFSEIEFKWQRLSDKKLFGDESLSALEAPGPNVTTVELLRRAEQDVSLCGNWFATNRFGGIRRLRPDWVKIVLGSDYEPEHPAFGEDAHVVGYVYDPPGSNRDPVLFTPNEIAHWSPIPDPGAQYRGMSWLTPIIREVMADNAGTDMKLKFYENGGTPNLVVRAPDFVTTQAQFDEFREKMEESSTGVVNMFRNLYLAAGGDATAVGLSLRELDFKSLQGGGETRVAVAGRVPAVFLGISEGLAGSALNAGNYSSARRSFSDGFCHPEWRDFCGCIQHLLTPPAGTRLWFDKGAVPFLREDAKDEAEIQEKHAGSIARLIEAGFVPESVINAIKNNDMGLLEHTGYVSVQLQQLGKAPDTPDTPPQEVGDE